MEETDNVLLSRYRQGQVDALEQLVEKYRRPLFGYILRMTGNPHEADEVFQEVWLKAIRKLGGYRQKNFVGWLMRIAHNLVIDRVRRRKPGFSLDEDRPGGLSPAETVAGRDPGPARELEQSDLAQHIVEAVATLPADQREVFVMRMQADLPFKEIARLQKVSINTALARMQYALAKLRPLLKEDYEEFGRA